jgi:hypothetical protein
MSQWFQACFFACKFLFAFGLSSLSLSEHALFVDTPYDWKLHIPRPWPELYVHAIDSRDNMNELHAYTRLVHIRREKCGRLAQCSYVSPLPLSAIMLCIVKTIVPHCAPYSHY